MFNYVYNLHYIISIIFALNVFLCNIFYVEIIQFEFSNKKVCINIPLKITEFVRVITVNKFHSTVAEWKFDINTAKQGP